MQLLLAADTATSICSVALCGREAPGQPIHTLAEAQVECGRKHAESLLDITESVLRDGGQAWTDLHLLAIGIGPGSFTGLRIGVAAWKGLAFALDLPLIPVPTLAAMSRIPAESGRLVCPMLDAKMSEVFAAAYRFRDGQRETVVEDAVLPPAEFLARIDGPADFFGDGAWRYRDEIMAACADAVFPVPEGGAPRATALASEAYSRYDDGVDADASRVAPVYLRQAQAEITRRSKLRDHPS